MPRLTKTVVEQFRATKDTTLGDTLLPGFGVRLRPPNPHKVFTVHYRLPNGTQRRRKLGVYGVLTVDEAREKARQWLAAVAQGRDPAQRDAVRAAPTLQDLAVRYLREHAQPKKKASSLRNDRWLLTQHLLPALGQVPVADLTPEAVARFHAALRPHPTTANRALSLLRAMLGLAAQWGLRPQGLNPVTGLPRYPERPRERYLTPAELARLWAVIEAATRRQAEHPSGLAALRLLLLTGARVGEILTLRWEMIAWQQGRARLPESKTGAKTLFLAPEALDVLRSLPRGWHTPWCLPGAKQGQHFVALPRLWYRLRAEAGLDGVRLHDLRHTFAANAAALGVPLLTIGALLGHRSAQTTQRYAHLLPEVVDAAARVVARRVAGSGE